MAKRRIGNEIVRTLGDLVSSAEAGTVRKTHRITAVRRKRMKPVRRWGIVGKRGQLVADGDACIYERKYEADWACYKHEGERVVRVEIREVEVSK